MRVTAAIVAVLAAAAAPAAAYEESVDVLFMAPYSSIADTVEDFGKQFSVMLLRTGAVKSDDVTAVVPSATPEGSILVTVKLASLQAAVDVTKAIEGRHLSVYIDGKGYIGVIPDSVPVTKAPIDTQPPATNPVTEPAASTEPAATTRATNPPATTVPAVVTTAAPGETTEHPATHGYVWLNEYTSDNENLNDCSTGNPWSGVVVSRMPVGCHRFQHPLTKQDEYNFLSLNSGAVGHFGMVCDTRCTSCISQVENFEFGSCVQTWGGSVAITSEANGVCLGATYLDQDEGTISVFRYSTAGCDLDAHMDAKLYIRNYPPVAESSETATCTRDGTSNSYYSLSKVADEHGDLFFNGVYGCADSDCSVGCIEVRSWQEGSCNRDAEGNGIAIWEADNALKECVTASDDNPTAGADADAHMVQADAAEVKVAAADVAVDEDQDEEVVVSTDATTVAASTTVAPNTTTAKPTTRRMYPTGVAPTNPDTGSSGAPAAAENKQLFAVMIAAGGVLAVAFLIAGVLHSRKRRIKEIEDNQYEDDDAMYDDYDYNGYSKYDNYDDWEDDRLVTDI